MNQAMEIFQRRDGVWEAAWLNYPVDASGPTKDEAVSNARWKLRLHLEKQGEPIPQWLLDGREPVK